MSQHSAKMDRLPPSLLRRNSSSIVIRSVNVPAATIVADEFAVFTIQVAEERLRLSLAAATLEEAIGRAGNIDTWTVMKRYSSMRTFHRGLRRRFGYTRRKRSKKTGDTVSRSSSQHSDGERKQEEQSVSKVPNEFEIPLPPFPPKKWFGNRAPRFVEERRATLAVYFGKLLAWAKVGVTKDVRMSMLREYLTFSDPEVAQHRMFAGIRHGPKAKATSPLSSLEHRHAGEEGSSVKV